MHWARRGPRPCWGTMSSNDFKNGSTIEMDGVPYRVQGEGAESFPESPFEGPSGLHAEELPSNPPAPPFPCLPPALALPLCRSSGSWC